MFDQRVENRDERSAVWISDEAERGRETEKDAAAFREEYSDISLDCSAITFDPPPAPEPKFLREKKRKKSKRNKSKEQKLVHLSKTKQFQSRAGTAASADIKEVTMQGSLNKATSASLTFENKKNTPMQLSAAVILVRVDEVEVRGDDLASAPRRIRAKGSGVGEAKSCSSSPSKSEKDSAFCLSPTTSTLVAPGEELKLRITFKPSRVALYSGVIKIKCGQKVFHIIS
jgi:hypothetical protein